jgi:hypothetical protein
MPDRHFRPSNRLRHPYLNLQFRRRRYIHQGIQRELRQLATEQVVRPGPGEAKAFYGVLLGKVPAENGLADFVEQGGARLQIGGFLFGVGQRLPHISIAPRVCRYILHRLHPPAAFLGLPPFAPFARTAAVFATDLTCPARRASSFVIHSLVPKIPATREGTKRSTSSAGQ